jgi:hypothetical protein
MEYLDKCIIANAPTDNGKRPLARKFRSGWVAFQRSRRVPEKRGSRKLATGSTFGLGSYRKPVLRRKLLCVPPEDCHDLGRFQEFTRCSACVAAIPKAIIKGQIMIRL